MANKKSNEKGSRLLNKYFNKGNILKENKSLSKNVTEVHVNSYASSSNHNEGSTRKFGFSSFRIKTGQPGKGEMKEGNRTGEKTAKEKFFTNTNNTSIDDLEFVDIRNETNNESFYNIADLNKYSYLNTSSLLFEKNDYEKNNNNDESVVPNSPFHIHYPSAIRCDKLEINSTDATPSTFTGNTNKNYLENYVNYINLRNGKKKKAPEVYFLNSPDNMSNNTGTICSPSNNAAYYGNGNKITSLNNMSINSEKGFSFAKNETNKRTVDETQQKSVFSNGNPNLIRTENNRKQKIAVLHTRGRGIMPKRLVEVSEHGQVIYMNGDKTASSYETTEMRQNDTHKSGNKTDPKFVKRKKNSISGPQGNISISKGKESSSVRSKDLRKNKIWKFSYNKTNKSDITDEPTDLNTTNGNSEGTNLFNLRTEPTNAKNENNKRNKNEKEKEKGKMRPTNTANQLSPQINYQKIGNHSSGKNNVNTFPVSDLTSKIEYTYDFEGNEMTYEKINNNNNNEIKKKTRMYNEGNTYSMPDYKKRNSFNYSGLLTSMVSSILSQQNEIKMEENNSLRSNMHKGSYKHYRDTANYSKELNYNNTSGKVFDGYRTKSIDPSTIKNMIDNKPNNSMTYETKPMEFEKYSEDKLLILTLIIMIFISILCNYDHGAIPVTLGEIQKDFPLSYIEQSLLGSLVYCGLIIGTIIAGVLFELLSAKILVGVSIFLLSISLYIFSHASCIMSMYICRFVNGLCQAIPVVYLPVWVDEFSPDEKATQWMSYIQLASIGGTVFGYFLGGILSSSDSSSNKSENFIYSVPFLSTWRSPFLIQAFLLVPIFVTLVFIPSNKINIMTNYMSLGESSEEDGSELKNREDLLEVHKGGALHKKLKISSSRSAHPYSLIIGDVPDDSSFQGETKYGDHEKPLSRSDLRREFKYSRSRINFNRSATYIMEKKTNVLKKTFKEVKKLLKNKLYIIITLGMSNLYFVVTGIQFWITEYMSVVLLTEKIKIVTVSTLCFLTSPTSGVWFGGYICDFFGGYKNTNYSKTIKVATAFAVSACIFGILSAQFTNFTLFSICLWLCLFNGSALVPVAVGMLLSCVDNHQKSLSSAVSQIIYNVFGWFSAPLLSGALMDLMHKYTHDNRLALKTGFTMILYSSTIGFILLFYANFLDLSDKKINDDATHEMTEPLKS